MEAWNYMNFFLVTENKITKSIRNFYVPWMFQRDLWILFFLGKILFIKKHQIFKAVIKILLF